MPIEQWLIAAGIGLFVTWAVYRVLRRPAEDARRPAHYSFSGATPVALPPSVARGNWLEGIGGDVEGKTFHVGARTVTVGRGVSNYIQTTDSDASRVHCRLTPVPTGVQVVDLSSGNGLLVNGVRVKEAVLHDGDELQIGRARFRYTPVGRFRYDDALGGKVVGAEAQRATIFNNPNMNVNKLAQDALQAAGGDVQEAARKLGVRPEVLLKLLE